MTPSFADFISVFFYASVSC